MVRSLLRSVLTASVLIALVGTPSESQQRDFSTVQIETTRLTDDNRLLATLEAMYLHVDMKSGKVVAAESEASKNLLALAATHAGLPKPEAAGRFVGQR